MYRKWNEEQLVEAVKKSNAIAQVLRELGLKPAGGNYESIRRAIADRGIDTSHFKGQSWSRGVAIGPKRGIEEYLSNRFLIQSDKLKKRLIREGFFERKCYSCDGRDWLSKPIPLELEHINGKHDDNTLSNLTLLCPNCHALTETYRGKNIGRASLV